MGQAQPCLETGAPRKSQPSRGDILSFTPLGRSTGVVTTARGLCCGNAARQTLTRRLPCQGPGAVRHLSRLESLTQVKLPAPPPPGWCSSKKCQLFAQLLLLYQLLGASP